MDYITPQLLPGRLTDTAAAVLRTVYLAVVWMPRPCDLNGDQLRALLALRNAGYIEFAAFGGYRIKTNQYTVASVEKPTPPTKADDLSQVEYIAIPQHRRSALVVMRDGRKMMFKVSAPEYLAGLVTLAKSLGKPEPFSYSGTMIYRVKVA
jgi:hypothetical protein